VTASVGWSGSSTVECDDEEAAVVELFADDATRLLDRHPLVNVVDTVEFY
jgi:hypothetical protein